MVSVGRVANDSTFSPVAMSSAVSSNTPDAATKPEGRDAADVADHHSRVELDDLVGVGQSEDEAAVVEGEAGRRGQRAEDPVDADCASHLVCGPGATRPGKMRACGGGRG